MSAGERSWSLSTLRPLPNASVASPSGVRNGGIAGWDAFIPRSAHSSISQRPRMRRLPRHVVFGQASWRVVDAPRQLACLLCTRSLTLVLGDATQGGTCELRWTISSAVYRKLANPRDFAGSAHHVWLVLCLRRVLCPGGVDAPLERYRGWRKCGHLGARRRSVCWVMTETSSSVPFGLL